MEADWEAGYLLTVRSAWQADNNIPNSKEASMGKAKAAPGGQRHHPEGRRNGRHHRLFRGRRCWRSGRATRKILDIFEGTQQIQQLVVARRLLGLSSSELK